MQLLFVEDDPVQALRWLLADAGFSVAETASGREAVDLVRVVKPALVVLDITLPDLDGISVARLLREHWPSLPIVFTTGHDGGYAGLPEALAAGPTRFLQKPYEVETLIATIRAMTA